MKKMWVVCCLALLMSCVSEPKPVDMAARAESLKSLKWGMFICWSFSTFSGWEWSPNINDVNFFRAKTVDTDEWARVAKESGMGYILFLTKHHDGFCLWDTKTTERKVTNAPLGRDVLAELRKSCDKYGIQLAIYFSEGDWSNPPGQKQGGKAAPNPELKKAQLKELLTEYGAFEYIWFDCAADTGGLSHAETATWCRQFQPACFVGFNHGDQTGADIKLGEMGKPAPVNNSKGTTYRLAEFTYPILPRHKGGANWFYSLPKHDGLCHPPEKLYKDYVHAVKFGNIFSVNIGPDYNGRLREIDVKTLRKVGEWIRNPETAPQVD